MRTDNWKEEIFSIQDDAHFNEICLKVFRYQYENVAIYRAYCDEIACRPEEVKSLEDIPFLPVSFFKTHRVIAKGLKEEQVFCSSGTTGTETSKHYVADLDWYHESILKGFEHFYGDPKDYCFLALLPSYLERKGASLVYMVDRLMHHSGHKENDYFIHGFDRLYDRLKDLFAKQQKVMLIGVSFALLDFVEAYRLPQNELLTVMETGGMKGRKKEMLRGELHYKLSEGFGVRSIHSEYGMTELLSQSYSKAGGRYFSVPWKKILVRDPNDPLSLTTYHSGAVNVIDLANVHSCSFIATQDLGRIFQDGSFEILGRIDYAQIRGCNLMYT